MAKEKKPVHKVQMTEGKRNIIHQLPQEYDIQNESTDTGKGVEAMLEMDYENMTIYWIYGDQGNVPAIRNNESRDDAAYPGADVVEIVNLRGYNTTIYKLADGTYLDRAERRFTYNGTDTWTGEGGVEWNESAKD